MTQDIYDDFLQRQDRYFRGHCRRLMIFCLVILLACTLMMLYISYAAIVEPKTSFFVSTSNGDLVPLVPAEQAALAKVTRSRIFEG